MQKAMVEVVVRRLFSHGGLDQCFSSSKAVFVSGSHWAAVARLCGPPNLHADAVLERVFDTKDLWSDSIKTLHRPEPPTKIVTKPIATITAIERSRFLLRVPSS